jgi:SAM-dependent methyltransferase
MPERTRTEVAGLADRCRSDTGSLHAAPPHRSGDAAPEDEPVSPELVRAAYRLLLGREPESADVVASGVRAARSVDALRYGIMGSPEFTRNLFSGGAVQRVALFNFLHPHTIRMTARRQEHLALLGLDLANKSVLEVGAGIGMHSSFFLDRGCTVLCTDGRAQNVSTMEALYTAYQWYVRRGSISFALLDIEADHIDKRFARDIVYCYGLLYHCADPAKAIRNLAHCCRELLLLETSVSPEPSNPSLRLGSENAADVSQSIHGHGSHPPREFIFAELGKHFPHVYSPVIQPAHEMFPEDWDNVSPLSRQTVRTVFIASRRELANPMLSKGLPRRQLHR